MIFLNLLVLLHIFSLMCIVSSHGVLQILLLGGNGFIGSHLSLALLEHQSRIVNITLVSRGNWPYDTAKTIEPYVFHIPCDRYDAHGLRGCSEFMNVVKHMAFDAVVDFSAYEPQVIREALLVLKQKAGLYIYISSDSVYEVCEKSEKSKIEEEDAVRPRDPELETELANGDLYGDQKLKGEELLTSQDLTPYIILRLPDVMGERDSTKRWWFYAFWIEHYKLIGEPIPIPTHIENLRTSYVYASDVGKLIADIIFGRFTHDINNQIFNIAFEQGLTLQELLNEMANISGIEIQFEIKENAPHMLPSVKRGVLDVSKAKKFLNFKPTNWKLALRKLMFFYKNAFKKFPKERQEIIDKITRLAIPKNKMDIVLTDINAGLL